MDFTMNFEIVDDENFDNNAYATFCIKYVESLTKMYRFKKEDIVKDDKNVRVFSMQIPKEIYKRQKDVPVIERKDAKRIMSRGEINES